ncbi:UNVERIFIED_CONTAM: hypothetical protein K2H54_007468 [Gekko kuhli]
MSVVNIAGLEKESLETSAVEGDCEPSWVWQREQCDRGLHFGSDGSSRAAWEPLWAHQWHSPGATWGMPLAAAQPRDPAAQPLLGPVVIGAVLGSHTGASSSSADREPSREPDPKVRCPPSTTKGVSNPTDTAQDDPTMKRRKAREPEEDRPNAELPQYREADREDPEAAARQEWLARTWEGWSTDDDDAEA